MAISEIHGIYAVRLFDTTMVSEAILDGVANQALTMDSRITREASSGVSYPRHAFISGQNFASQLSTMRLEDWFDEVGFAGKKIETDVGKPGIVLYGQLYDEVGGGRSAGSTHRTYTMARGYIVPRTLTVDHQGDATLQYDYFIIYDGTNDPIVIAESQAVPTLVGDDQRFTLGGITLGGTTFDQVQSMTIDFGVTVRTESGDSDVYPTKVSIADWSPTITLRGNKAKWLGATGIGIGGLSCTHANTTIYLRKRAEAGTHFVANGTAEHIKITAAGLAVVETAQDAASGQSSESSIRLDTKYDGTNTPVVVTTASAIT